MGTTTVATTGRPHHDRRPPGARSPTSARSAVRGRSARSLAGGALALAAAFAVVCCEKLPAIPNVPPVAVFVYSPVSPINSGETVVTFNASGSTDTDGHV